MAKRSCPDCHRTLRRGERLNEWGCCQVCEHEHELGMLSMQYANGHMTKSEYDKARAQYLAGVPGWVLVLLGEVE